MFNRLFELIVVLAGKDAYYQVIELVEATARKPLSQMNDIELNAVESVLRKIYQYLIGRQWAFAPVLEIILNAEELKGISPDRAYIWN